MTDHGLANNLTEYGDKEFALYLRRSFAKAMGFSEEALAKPIVGIANTYSELNNCHRHFPELIEDWNSRIQQLKKKKKQKPNWTQAKKSKR